MIRAHPRHPRSIDAFFVANANWRTVYTVENRSRKVAELPKSNVTPERRRWGACIKPQQPTHSLDTPPAAVAQSSHGSSRQAHNNNAGVLETHMSDCPLVRPATNLKPLPQFEQTGQVVIPVTYRIRFFEALAFMNRDGLQETCCAIVEGSLVFSKTPFKKNPASR